MRVAFSSMAWNTGSSSPGELEMTLSTSEVAVCCSSASVSSRVRACTSSNRRAFSMAISAWSAKVVTSSICLSLNGCTTGRRQHDDADRDIVAQQRDAEDRAKTAMALRVQGIFGVGENIRDVNRAPLDCDAACHRAAIRNDRILPQEFDVFCRSVLSWRRGDSGRYRA